MSEQASEPQPQPAAPTAADYLAFGQVWLNQAAKIAADGDFYGASEQAQGAIPYLLCALALELGVPATGDSEAIIQ